MPVEKNIVKKFSGNIMERCWARVGSLKFSMFSEIIGIRPWNTSSAEPPPTSVRTKEDIAVNSITLMNTLSRRCSVISFETENATANRIRGKNAYFPMFWIILLPVSLIEGSAKKPVKILPKTIPTMAPIRYLTQIFIYGKDII